MLACQITGVWLRVYTLSTFETPPFGTDSECPVQLGKNLEKKVRKHIDQVRNRVTPPEDIPSPGTGGIKRVAEIIHERVAKGGGREATYAGETVVAFEDGGVTYIFRSNGEFWTILGN